MKKLLSILLLVTLLFTLTGCVMGEKEVAGCRFARKNDNQIGDYFTISIYKDGNFSYYETLISSHVGMGEWKIEENMLVLYEKENQGESKVFYFQMKNGKLIFDEERSDLFMYVKLLDGAEFTRQQRLERDSLWPEQAN